MSAPRQVIGHYRVGAKLGAGGMGEVWRATDTRLNREVAIKVLPAGFADDAMRMGRFAREAQVLASLNHPGIAAIYGVEDRALVMELVEGPTLAERIGRGAIPLEEALPIATQIAEALEYAHEKGVIHRDLKPANIKVTPEGRVKILDFGLAKAMNTEASASTPAEAATLSSPATMAGAILGTAAYMAPEQARGQNVDPRADIWAFGVVLYEMLTGERPFGGPTISDTLAAVLTREPELANVAAGTREVIEGCLRKDSRRRWQAVGDVRLALAGELPAQSQPGATPAPRRERMVWSAVAAMLALSAAAAAWWLKPAAPRVVARFEYPLPEGQAFDRLGSHVLAISPDGTKIVYVANQQLYLRGMDQLEAQPIRGTDEDPVEPVFSPDGQWIAYFRPGIPGTLRKIAVSGGVPVTLCQTTSSPYGMSWRKDTIAFGQYLAGQIDAIQAVADTGGAPRTLISVDPKDGRVTQPELLNDGRHVLFTLVPATPAPGGLAGEGQIAVQGFDGSPRRVILTGGTNPRVLPTGQLVYLHDSTLFAVRFDSKREAIVGSPVSLIEGVREANGVSNAGQFAVSRDGTLVYWPGSNLVTQYTLLWVDRQGHEQSIAAPPRSYEYPRLSPDGTKIAVNARDQQNDIWIWDLAKQTLGRLTFGEGFKFYPTWMPDSRGVVFEASASNTPAGDPRAGVFRRASDGTGVLETLARDGAGGMPQSISPDGKWLVLHVGTIPYGMALLPLEGGGPATPLPLSEAKINVVNGEISPDGRWIAYQSNESGRSEVYVRPFPAVTTGHWQISTDRAGYPVWSRNGRELYFISAKDLLMAAPIQSATGFNFGTPQPLFTVAPFYIGALGRTYDVAADGRFLFEKNATNAPAARQSIEVVTHWLDEVNARVK